MAPYPRAGEVSALPPPGWFVMPRLVFDVVVSRFWCALESSLGARLSRGGREKLRIARRGPDSTRRDSTGGVDGTETESETDSPELIAPHKTIPT